MLAKEEKAVVIRLNAIERNFSSAVLTTEREDVCDFQMIDVCPSSEF